MSQKLSHAGFSRDGDLWGLSGKPAGVRSLLHNPLPGLPHVCSTLVCLMCGTPVSVSCVGHHSLCPMCVGHWPLSHVCDNSYRLCLKCVGHWPLCRVSDTSPCFMRVGHHSKVWETAASFLSTTISRPVPVSYTCVYCSKSCTSQFLSRHVGRRQMPDDIFHIYWLYLD